MKKIRVKYHGQEYETKSGTTPARFLKEHNIDVKDPVAAILNGRLTRLNKTLRVDSTLRIINLSSFQGQRIYESTLTFVFLAAFRKICPSLNVFVQHSIPGGLYLEVKDGALSENQLGEIKAYMQKLIDDDKPFQRVTRDWDLMMDYLASQNRKDLLRLYRYQQKEPVVKVYELDGVEEIFYLPVLPSTGYLKEFDLRLYNDGVALVLPDFKTGKAREFKDFPKLFETHKKYHKWSRLTKVRTVGHLNNHIMNGEIGELIQVGEALHDKQLTEMADKITSSDYIPRLVLIAGPSSSGKTTFSKRLGIHLRVNGYRPIAISLDNYFVERSKTPLDEEGNYDFECLEAIDVPLFNDHLNKLLNGDEVEIPRFDFQTGSRKESGVKLRLAEDEILIIEGIHGINPKLTSAVDDKHKFKIYISALTQLNLHHHDRIPTSDTRLIRRIVRDSSFRGYTAGDTLNQWRSVRAGEEKNIFPLQEEADAIFNSALFFELSILKQKAERELLRVPKDHAMYAESQRLLNFLSYFLPYDSKDLPKTSLLREFVGDSSFKY